VLSARSTGIYMYLLLARPQISAESLSGVFSEGEAAIATCLRELREAGLIITRKEHINGHIMTVSCVVEPDSWTPETAVLIKHTPLNSLLSTNSLFSKKQTEYIGGPDETYQEYDLKIGASVDDFPASYDPEDIEKARQRAREAKYREKEEAKSKKNEIRMQKRSGDPANWSITDTAFEFANRMHELWHVKPWAVTTSRFRIALAKAQSEHGTNGTLEKMMIDLYFQQIKHDTAINDPEHIWKRFIQQFAGLKIQAERLMVTPEDIETEKVKAEKSWDWVNDVQS
jgi:biotin operon repressor